MHARMHTNIQIINDFYFVNSHPKLYYLSNLKNWAAINDIAALYGH